MKQDALSSPVNSPTIWGEFKNSPTKLNRLPGTAEKKKKISGVFFLGKEYTIPSPLPRRLSGPLGSLLTASSSRVCISPTESSIDRHEE